MVQTSHGQMGRTSSDIIKGINIWKNLTLMDRTLCLHVPTTLLQENARYHIPMKHDAMARIIWKRTAKKKIPTGEINYIETHGLKEHSLSWKIKATTNLEHNWLDVVWDHKEKLCFVMEIICPLDTKRLLLYFFHIPYCRQNANRRKWKHMFVTIVMFVIVVMCETLWFKNYQLYKCCKDMDGIKSSGGDVSKSKKLYETVKTCIKE